MVGGRVDSPPTIHRGTVLFGSADGWVYCLRLSDGDLIWRFLAAPADVRTVANDRLESVWPVHGSVLVLGDVAYCSAGRSTWLDGGIRLYGLDPATGKILHRHHFVSRHPEIGAGKTQAEEGHQVRIDQNLTDYKTFLQADRSDAFSMAEGAVSDVLVSDGTNVFLHHVAFSADWRSRIGLPDTCSPPPACWTMPRIIARTGCWAAATSAACRWPTRGSSIGPKAACRRSPCRPA
jgi:outer membrane protein assembly factor BamB